MAWQSYTVAEWLALKKSGIATIGIGTTVSHEEEWHSGLPRIRGALKFSISPEDQNEIRTSSALRQNSNRGSFLFGEIQFKRPSRIENFFVLPGQSFKRFPIKKNYQPAEMETTPCQTKHYFDSGRYQAS